MLYDLSAPGFTLKKTHTQTDARLGAFIASWCSGGHRGDGSVAVPDDGAFINGLTLMSG
jgi:hypothetical protein